ncbi:hypothetical protein B9Z55_018257 [Caenorhabditis nigoni]|uniref:DUF281 domain-containing protein n=1 Tax=Caenorhabditis nigoni TaxID=1611254 RepID=A0A2G5TD92_9PELO|nr:hypothetical protein B9Z55_018257 [Caenorhabditis nigoni]
MLLEKIFRSNINQLECLYDTCAVPIPCAECNLNTIGLPTNLPTGAVFNSVDYPDGNCKLTMASCARNDGKTCVQIAATLTFVDGSTTSSYGAYVQTQSVYLFCGNDGLYHQNNVHIMSIKCEYANCN